MCELRQRPENVLLRLCVKPCRRFVKEYDGAGGTERTSDAEAVPLTR